MNGLETVFSQGHELHDRIYYDANEGKYYDRYTDLYLELNEVQSLFGIR